MKKHTPDIPIPVIPMSQKADYDICTNYDNKFNIEIVYNQATLPGFLCQLLKYTANTQFAWRI